MELFEFVLIVLVCVGLSSAFDHIISSISLPVLQVVIGLVAAIVLPSINEVAVESELFLVLFIAPLLFNETREVNPRELWHNRGDILSLAVGLVVISVLAVGYMLNWLVPSIPLAAAFALGGALGPTDAAAVTALRSSVNLNQRQKTLLSGESLINDASGVVAFQFAVAAAVTGTFSLAEAAGSFLVLFVGGIVVGALLGAVISAFLRLLGNLGLEDATSHAFYELLTPFIVFLMAEAIGVSGILAVVAAGLVMAAPRPRFHSTFDARRKLVSDSLWEIVSFLINGTVFVLLGMQLPHVVTPGLAEGLSSLQVIGVIIAIALTSLVCRFIWVYILELRHVHHGESLSDGEHAPVVDALVTTVAGAKGAVTLSIVLTLPALTASGAPFPERDLIITIAAGVILFTLLLADTLLPRLAPVAHDDTKHERELTEGRTAVLEGTADELEQLAANPSVQDYVPALRLTLGRYKTRAAMERLSQEDISSANEAVETEEAQRQATELERLHQHHLTTNTEEDWQLHLRVMRGIRRSVGYQGRMTDVVQNKHHRLHTFLDAVRHGGRIRRWWEQISEDDFSRVYGQACIYALELEYVSLDYFEEVMAGDDPDMAQAASIRHDVHELAARSIWDRLNYGNDVPLEDQTVYTLPYDPKTHEFKASFREQFAKARAYARDVDENALRIELDVITRLQGEGQLSRDIANELREEVYLLQISED